MAYLRILGRGGVVPPPPSTKLGPSSQWNGTGGEGFDGAALATPVDPERTGGKPWCVPLFVPNQTFSGDLTLAVDAGINPAFGTVDVTFMLEGAGYSPLFETAETYSDSNSDTHSTYGHHCTLDYNAIMARSATGTVHLYIKTTPSNPMLRERVIGPFVFYARAPGVGPDKQHDIALDITPSLGNSTGVRYQTLKGALDYCKSNSKIRPLITVTETCTLKGESCTTSHLTATTWATLTAAPGVTATLGDGTVGGTGWLPKYDGLRFMGSGIVVDTAGLNYTLTSAVRCETGSNKLLWFDGCEITTGAPNPAQGGHGSGVAALYKGQTSSSYWLSVQDASAGSWYFTEVNAHDLSGYGLSNSRLVRNCTTARVSGSGHENSRGAIHGGTTSTISGFLSGLRAHENAFTLAYSGAAAVVEYECTLNNGSNNRVFKVWEDGVNTRSTTMSTALNTPTQVTDLVTTINGWTGFTATLSGTPTRAAPYLSLSSLAPSAAIPRTTLLGTQQFTTIIDIHSDTLVWHTTTYENVAVRDLTVLDSCASAAISFDKSATLKDFAIRDVECQDTSVANGATMQNGYWNADMQHVLIQHLTQMDSGAFMSVASSGFSADSYCAVDHCSLKTLSWSTTADADLVISSLVVQEGTVPSGADANSKTLGGAATNTLYTSTATPDFTPLSPLVLTDTTIAGARDLSGNFQR